MGAASWFTRRLEAICDELDLSAGILSILGALGANIPNYTASIAAIAGGHIAVGLGIIIGSNIYNTAIILGLAPFAAHGRTGIRLGLRERQDVRAVAEYTVLVLLATLAALWLLPGTPVAVRLSSLVDPLLLIGAVVLVLGIFGGFVFHIVRRPHPPHYAVAEGSLEEKELSNKTSSGPLVRWIVEALLALVVALAGVNVMVESGQELALMLHIPQALVGLVILAVATSLPNTVVALFLVRTDRTAACVEEIFSSNSVNAALGIAFPLLFWHEVLHTHTLLLLDGPLMVALTVSALVCVFAGRVGRSVGLGLLFTYAVWVAVQVWI